MSDYFDRVERQLVHAVEARAGRRPRSGFRRGGPRFAVGLRTEHLALAAAIAAVLVVGAVFLGLRGHGSSSDSPAADGVQLVFTASASAGRPATTSAIDRTVATLRRRLATSVPGARISRLARGVLVVLEHPSAAAQARVIALSAPGRLAFYDWEADTLTAGGQTVASRLARRDKAALAISQGNGSTAPGGSGSGSLTLRQAAAVAAKGHIRYGVGTLILRAFAVSPAPPPPAQFYALLDQPALTGRDLVNPRQSTDTSGSPDVSFGFTSHGRTAFQHVTSALAHRGASVSGLGLMLNQHFAIALDGRLISVPSVDYKTYPNGVSGETGADITGSFNAQSARDLATILRFGPLRVRLAPR